MSAAASPAVPGPRARGPVRALLLLAALLALAFVPLAAAPAGASAPPPAAASSCESGELHQDAPEAALRLPTGHPTRLPTAPLQTLAPRSAPRAPGTTAHPANPSQRALRTVVLRC